MQKKSIFRFTIDTEILNLVYFSAIERKTILGKNTKLYITQSLPNVKYYTKSLC